MRNLNNDKLILYGFLWIVIFSAPLYIIRFNIFSVPTNLLDVLIGAGVLFGGTFFVYKKQLFEMLKTAWAKNKFFLLTAILVLVGAISSVAVNPPYEDGLGIIKSWFVLPMGLAFTLLLLLQREKEVEKMMLFMLSAYILSSVFVSIVSLWYAFSGQFTYDGRLTSWYLSPNHLALYITPSIVLLWFLIRQKSRLFFRSEDTKKWVVFLLWFALAITLYLTYSYAAWISAFLSILIGELFLQRISRQKTMKVLFFGLVAVIVIVFFQFDSQKFHNLVNFDERSSLASRFMIWKSAWSIGKDNWFLGIGPGNFQNVYLEYQQHFPPYLEWAVPQPHNLFLAFWLQTGSIGLFGFIALLATFVFKAFEALRRSSNVDKQKRALVIALFASFASIILYGLVDTPIWKNDLALVFWIIATVLFISFHKLKNEEPLSS